MNFALIRAPSRLLIVAATAFDGSASDAERAAGVLRSDYERWSRWTLGLLSFVLAVVGSFIAVGLLGTVAMLGGVAAGLDLVALVLAGAVGVLGIAMLARLWWTGRQLVSAAVWWLRLPHTRGGRVRRASGWVRARTVNLEPRIFARLTTATFALLLAVGGAALVLRDVNEGLTSFTAATAVVAVVSGLAGLGQAAGVVHLVSGISEGDPVWARVRSLFLGRSSDGGGGRR